MRLSAVILMLVTLALPGCSGEGEERGRIVAYHLEEHWAESEPPATREDLTVPADARVVYCEPPASACPGLFELPRRRVYYALTGEPELTPDDFARSSARATFSRSAGPVVHVMLTDEGRDRFRTLTRRIAHAGRRERRVHHLALVVDDRLVGFPAIDYQHTPEGIDSDVVEITGLTATEAEDLASALRGD